MKPERWRQIKQLYQSVLETEEDQRESFLEEACAGDEDLRQEVASLLECQPEAEQLLQSPAIDLVAKALASDQLKTQSMDLTGRTIAHYSIVKKIGKGGMAEVFLAEDTSLHRKVALKFLTPHDPEDTAAHKRLLREAHSAAALDHPYICHINEVAEYDGRHYIVMEYVEGQSLKDRLLQGPLPPKEALAVGIEITEALEAAHAKGIVHRDIKPANIMLTHGGHAKVMDFGLAKQLTSPAHAEAVADPETLPSDQVTLPGFLMGTVSYMSPEQACGMELDFRSDLFSAGVVLYEMATGQLPFQGQTTVEVFSAIVHGQHRPLRELTEFYPPSMTWIIDKVLEKDREVRYQTAADLRADLKRAKRELDSGKAWVPQTANKLLFSSAQSPHNPKSNERRRRMAFLLAPMAIIAILAYWLLPRLPGLFSTDMSEEADSFLQLTDQPGPEYFPSLSPDGRSFVYASNSQGNWDILLQRIGGRIPINLTKDCAEDDSQPAFSPDGELIAFRSERSGGGIYVMGATGESVHRLTDFGYNPSWSPKGDEVLVSSESITRPEDRMTTGSQIWSILYPGGEKRLIYNGDAVQPRYSPSGARIAFWSIDATGMRNIYTVAAKSRNGATPAAVPVTDTGFVNWDPVWSPSGNALYFSSDRSGSMSIWRVEVDERSGEVLSRPEAIHTPSSDSGHISLSANGRRLAYIQYLFKANLYAVQFDSVSEQVKTEPIPITQGSRQATRVALSPDGQWLAFNSWSKQEDLFVVRTDGTSMRELTNDIWQDRGPRWSPDGKHLTFFSNRSGKYEAWTISFDGNDLQKVTNHPEHMVVSPIWSPHGNRLACSLYGIRSFIKDLDRPSAEETPVDIQDPNIVGYFQAWSWSGSGNKLAGYLIRPDGSAAGIGVYSLDSMKFEKLTDYGMDPVWLSDDRRLLFYDNGGIDLVDSSTKRTHSVLSVGPLTVAKRGFALSSDDSRIYFSMVATEADIWLLNRGGSETQ